MDDFLKSLLEGSSGLGAYGLVFGVLTACGLGLPLPEDISLILGGFLAHKGAAQLEWMMVTGLLGILAGDSLIFYAGRKWGSKVGGGGGTGFFSRMVTPEKRAKVEGLFVRHGEKIVMVARFMPGVRAVTYFTAGSVGMKFRRFLLWDGLAALGSAPIFVFLGYYFGGELDRLIHGLKQGQMGVFGTLGVILVGWLGFRYIRARRRAAQALLESQKILPEPASVTPLVSELNSGRERVVATAEATYEPLGASAADRKHG